MTHTRSRNSIRLAAVSLAALMLGSVVIADSLVPGPDMSWCTVDGGGAISTGETVDGSFEFTGTIGQPDANESGPLTSGVYSFSPGYWNDHMIGAPACMADLNGDGFINVNDLLLVITNWGGTTTGDATHDGVVDVNDLLLVITNWGTCPLA